jgi:hypothetical protein
MYRDLEDMRQSLAQILTWENGAVTAFVGDSLPPGAVDALARNAVFHPDPTIRTQLRQVLRGAAAFRGIRLATLGEAPAGHGVRLAVRLGGHCYDLARLVLRSAGARGAGSVVFEQGWAGQSPWEFSALLAAAALRENWRFPLHLRCCLPPLSGDLLGGGEDVEALGDRLSTASRAELANVTLRVSPAGLLRPRSHGELCALLRQAREQGQSVSLRVQEPDAEAKADPVLLDALHNLTRDHAPRLLTLGSGARHWPAERIAAWRRAAGGAGLALSGLLPASLLDPESAPLPAGLEELRVDFDWATRIVLHPEFLAERRREVLGWLRTHRPDAERLSDAQLLALHEYQALGHFEFELWDLDRMPSFRADFMAMLDQLYTVLGLA